MSYEKSTFMPNAAETTCSSVHQMECSPNSAQLLKSVFVKNVGWASQVRNGRLIKEGSLFFFPIKLEIHIFKSQALNLICEEYIWLCSATVYRLCSATVYRYVERSFQINISNKYHGELSK